MLRKLDSKDIWVRKFEIPQSTKHKQGFTVYKVVSTVFPKSFPDGATKITVWKRYKDFKKLHKDLEAFFHHLYLKGKFPQLPKDKFFGRFDDAVIEERRKFALELLEFSATHSQLFMNKIFVRFFEDGHHPKDFIDGGSLLNGAEITDNVLVEEEDTRFEECLVPEKIWKEKNGIDSIGEEEPSTSPSFSCDSSKPASPTLDVSQVLLSGQNSPSEIPTNISQSSNAAQTPNIVTFTDSSQFNESHSVKPSTSVYVPSPYSLQESKTLPHLGSSASLTEDLDVFDGEFDLAHSKTRIQNFASSLSLNTLVEPPQRGKDQPKKSHFGFNLFDFLPIFSKKQEKSKQDEALSSSYVREAAGHFSAAHHHESNLEYSLALEAYTEGIRILLEGAQGDDDRKRRSLVRKKVEKYLSNAELLKQKLKTTEGCDSDDVISKNSAVKDPRNEFSEGFVMVDSNVMPSSVVELKSYKVVGCTFNNILIAVDTTSSGGPDCFAIKVLRKSPSPFDAEKPSLIPSAIPFMVQLVKWFNTEDAVVLVLQFAAGGRLLNFVLQYQSKQILDSHSSVPSAEENENVVVKEEKLISPVTAVFANHKPSENSTRLEIGAGDSFDLSVPETNSSIDKEYDASTLQQHLSGDAEKDEDSLPAKSLKTGAESVDLQIETLIANSKALLKTVSKTLEDQKTIPVALYQNTDTLEIPNEPLDSACCDTTRNGSYFELSDTFTKLLRTNGNLGTEVDDEGNNSKPVRMVPECCVKVWAAELIISLDKLHTQGITYGDLDIHNILLGDNGHILLTYRALWNEVDSRCEVNEYSAPEVVHSLSKAYWRLHPSVDWWSLGAILYFLLTGLKLQDVHPEGIHPQTVICVPESNIVGEPLSPSSISLLVELLQFTPTLRLGYYGAEEIKSHPFFTDFDWNAADNSN